MSVILRSAGAEFLLTRDVLSAITSSIGLSIIPPRNIPPIPAFRKNSRRPFGVCGFAESLLFSGESTIPNRFRYFSEGVFIGVRFFKVLPGTVFHVCVKFLTRHRQFVRIAVEPLEEVFLYIVGPLLINLTGGVLTLTEALVAELV